MTAYATITGRVTPPGSTVGIPGDLTATPLTEGAVLPIADEDRVNVGPATAAVTGDGSIDPDLSIPIIDGVLWRLTFVPKGKGKLPVRLGDYAITASGDIADLVPVQVTVITPTVAANIAAAAALGATNDTATASFLDDDDSATRGKLVETVGTRVSLARYGLASTDVKAALDAAVADGRTHVLIPKRSTPWPMTSKFTGTGLTIEFEPGARVSCNMGTGYAFDLTASTLINASFTSPFTGLTSAADWPSYGLPARGVLFRDDCRTEGDYYHEYATTGIQVIGARCRIMGDATFHGMRHRTGWAEGIHIDGGLGGVYDFVCHGTVTVTDSDRAIEVEEGVYDITFAGGGRFTNVFPNGYSGQPVVNGSEPDTGSAYATYTFTLGAHSHLGGGGSRNVRYLGKWVLNNCGAGPQFIRSSGTSDADMPRDCYVEDVTVNGLALAPGYQAVALQGHNNVIDRVHLTTGSGIAGSLLRVRGYGGTGNVVKRITTDTATRNFIRVDNDEGGGLRAGDVTMPALTGHVGKYAALAGAASGTSNTLGNNTLRLVPFYLATPLTISHIGCEVTAAGNAGATVRVGIFEDAGGLPGSPIVDKTVAADAVGAPEASNFTVLAPGWYWVGGVVQNAATTQPTLRTTGAGMFGGYPLLGNAATDVTSVSAIGHAKTGVSGALSAFGTTPSLVSVAPKVFVKLTA